MSKENSRERIIQLAFGAYPEAKQFHFTSDNQAFSEASDAKNHSTTLKDKEVELIKRADLKKLVGKDAEGAEGSEEKVSKEATEKGAEGKAFAGDERAVLAAEYEQLLSKKPAHNLGLAKMQAAIDEAKAALKETESKDPIKKILTQEDLDANPELVEQGAVVGDEFETPGE